MKLTNIHNFIALSALHTVAAQQFKGYVVSSLSSATHYGTPGSTTPSISRVRRQASVDPYYHQITFGVHDRQPATNTETRCEAWWATDAAVPEWASCEDPSFEFQMLNWTAVDNFILDVKHSYQDPAIGPPGMDVVTTWGKAEFAVPESLECVKGSMPFEQYCGLVEDTIELPIYQAIA